MTKEGKKRRASKITVSTSLVQAVLAELRQLHISDDTERSFPSSLTSEERAYIHQVAQKMGFHSKSRGKQPHRVLTVFKREKSSIIELDTCLRLSAQSRLESAHLFPPESITLTTAEQTELRPATDPPRHDGSKRGGGSGTGPGGACGGGLPRWGNDCPSRSLFSPRVPVPTPPVITPRRHRDKLPIAQHRATILQAIAGNSVVIVVAPTGSGKTTQVPQFIMEDYAAEKKPCRIIVTEPRRIAALSNADRVAWERGEKSGVSVGYCIRNDCKFTPGCTVLTYCTTGVVLRYMMGTGCEAALTSVTHMIVDEVHERDLDIDLLLICLRDIRSRLPQLRVILMSATADTTLLQQYFNSPAVVIINPTSNFSLRVHYLHDVLRETKYTNPKMQSYLLNDERMEEPIVPTCADEVNKTSEAQQTREVTPDNIDARMWSAWEVAAKPPSSENSTDDDLSVLLEQLLTAVGEDVLSIDHREPRLGLTLLMIATVRRRMDIINLLLRLGADPRATSPYGHTAADLAKRMDFQEVAVALEQAQQFVKNGEKDFPLPDEITAEDKRRESAYLASVSDNLVIDNELIFALIHHIHFKCKPGAILVFLPGYDEITRLRERIAEDPILFSKLHIVILHSQLPIRQQFNMLEATPPNMRKCILATNVAETSLTIDDVTYVIDCGKAKERSCESELGPSVLETEWVSRANAMHRKGRAGRVCDGHCYRVYSVQRYLSLQPYATPEILRSPLQSICLQVKCLASPGTAIADFIAKAIEPPHQQATRNAVQYLKAIDALHPWEDLTELGSHLVQIHTDPRIAKMVVWGCVLKCLDPVLTIASCLGFEHGPFLMATSAEERQRLAAAKDKLSENIRSDHFILLRAYQGFIAADRGGHHSNNSQHHRGPSSLVHEYCREMMLSRVALERIREDRDRLLQQLRACDLIRAKPPHDVHDANRNSHSWPAVKAALAAAAYPEFARVDCGEAKRKRLVRLRNFPVVITKSPLDAASDWLIYHQITRRGNYVRIEDTTAVSPLTVALFAGPSRLPPDHLPDLQGVRAELFPGEVDSDSDEQPENELAEEDDVTEGCDVELKKPNSIDESKENENKPSEEEIDKSKTDGVKLTGGKLLKLDDWISFLIQPEDAPLVIALRQKIQLIFLKRLSTNHSRSNLMTNDAFILNLVKLLEAEESNIFGPASLPEDVGLSPAVTSRSVPIRPGVGGGGGNPAIRSGRICGSITTVPAAQPRRFVVVRLTGPTRGLPDYSTTTGRYSFPPSTHQKISAWVRGEGREVIAVFYAAHAHAVMAIGRIRGPQQVRAWPLFWLRRPHPHPLPLRDLESPLVRTALLNAADGQELEEAVGRALLTAWRP